MRVFHCDHCGNLIFFENTACVGCGHRLAYLPDLQCVASLDEADDGTWTTPIPRAEGRRWRLCENYSKHEVCNWAVPIDTNEATDEPPRKYCPSCELTRVIPDLDDYANKQRWYKLETAKRRLVYTLDALHLPLRPKAPETDDTEDDGLAFEFRADSKDPKAPRVLTGHACGVITINVIEADDPERERRRIALHEPYRTLIGHLRHEVGHYYWDVLLRDDPERLARCRELFGDDQADYSESLKKHYKDGPSPDWQSRYISAYASVHAWEDWAETWAHYLHMIDALEAAATSGVSLRPQRRDDPNIRTIANPLADRPEKFDTLLDGWFPLTFMLNNLNRGLGLADAYPFVLSEAVIDKLRFIHETVMAVGKVQHPRRRLLGDSAGIISRALRAIFG